MSINVKMDGNGYNSEALREGAAVSIITSHADLEALISPNIGVGIRRDFLFTPRLSLRAN